jgi:small subunit ribosomal protein S19
MSRSLWKGFFFESFFFKRLKKNVHVWSRASVIPQSLVGFTINVYNGKTFKKLKVTREKVGFKFGFFVNTRNKRVKEKKRKV